MSGPFRQVLSQLPSFQMFHGMHDALPSSWLVRFRPLIQPGSRGSQPASTRWSRSRRRRVVKLRLHPKSAHAMAEGTIVELSSKAIEKLDLTPEVREALLAVQADLTAAYQQRFVEMIQAISRQASALERLQNTLNILVEHLAPTLKSRLPVALAVTAPGEAPDVASVAITADPIGAGYTLTQAAFAEALSLSLADVSVLARAFKLSEDENCAIVVRHGKNYDIVNYHPRALDRFRRLVAQPPAGLSRTQRAALDRVAKKLIMDGR
jgi:hypothetical protein